MKVYKPEQLRADNISGERNNPAAPLEVRDNAPAFSWNPLRAGRREPSHNAARPRMTDLRSEDELRRLKSEIEEQNYTIRQLKREILKAKETADHEIQQLKKDKKGLTRELDKSRETLRGMKDDLRLARDNLEDNKKQHKVTRQSDVEKITRLERENHHHLSRTQSLAQKLEDLQSDYDAYLQRSTGMRRNEPDSNSGRTAPLESEISSLKSEIVRLREKEEELRTMIFVLEEENKNLHEYVAHVNQEPESTHGGEVYYSGLFEELNSTIRSWAVKHSKINSKETLTPIIQTQILDSLRELGNKGQLSAIFLEPCLSILYTSRQYRIPLLRHVFSVFLFDQIFDRFLFGLDQTTSRFFWSVEDDLFKQG